MADTPTYATVIVLAVLIAVLTIDVCLAVNKRKGDTYSEVIRRAAKRWWPLALLITFSMGLLAGHWFWCPDPCDNPVVR
jgi:succinate dehydrogenase hydrophobic anchor subunit